MKHPARALDIGAKIGNPVASKKPKTAISTVQKKQFLSYRKRVLSY